MRIKNLILLLSVLILGACAGPAVDKVVVKKSESKMFLLKKGEVVKAYDVAFGANPVGHKERRGDMRTPEGRYNLTYKNPYSRFYKSIRIDYPNSRDLALAQMRGLDPGSDIVIHGLPNGMRDEDIIGELSPKNWTEGCIAVRNHEMDEIWHLVQVDTPITIYP